MGKNKTEVRAILAKMEELKADGNSLNPVFQALYGNDWDNIIQPSEILANIEKLNQLITDPKSDPKKINQIATDLYIDLEYIINTNPVRGSNTLSKKDKAALSVALSVFQDKVSAINSVYAKIAATKSNNITADDLFGNAEQAENDLVLAKQAYDNNPKNKKLDTKYDIAVSELEVSTRMVLLKDDYLAAEKEIDTKRATDGTKYKESLDQAGGSTFGKFVTAAIGILACVTVVPAVAYVAYKIGSKDKDYPMSAVPRGLLGVIVDDFKNLAGAIDKSTVGKLVNNLVVSMGITPNEEMKQMKKGAAAEAAAATPPNSSRDSVEPAIPTPPSSRRGSVSADDKHIWKNGVVQNREGYVPDTAAAAVAQTPPPLPPKRPNSSSIPTSGASDPETKGEARPRSSSQSKH